MCFDKGCRGGKVGRRQGGGGRRVQKQEPEPISDFKILTHQHSGCSSLLIYYIGE